MGRNVVRVQLLRPYQRGVTSYLSGIIMNEEMESQQEARAEDSKEILRERVQQLMEDLENGIRNDLLMELF